MGVFHFNLIISAITDAISCFPQSLGSIVRRLYTVLVDQRKLGREQVFFFGPTKFLNSIESVVVRT